MLKFRGKLIIMLLLLLVVKFYQAYGEILDNVSKHTMQALTKEGGRYSESMIVVSLITWG